MDSLASYLGMDSADQAELAELTKNHPVLQKLVERLKVMRGELAQANATAENASSAKTLFLAMMSHELRTPMTGILGILDLLMDSRLDGEQYRLMKLMKNSANGLLNILNDILDFSKIEAGQMQLESIPFDAVRVFQEAFDHFQFMTKEKHLDYQIQMAADAEYWSLFLGDPMRIRQIVMNLISNAIKFTSSGSVILSANLLNPTPKGAELVFSVKDTGLGMTEEQSARLFNAFVQAGTDTTRRFGGTGLGLAIVKRLIDNMNGSVKVETALGQGSTFTVQIPLQWAVQENNVSGTPESTNANSDYGLRVLVVEDNDINQMLITSAMGRAGHFVQVAENGQQALDAVMISAAKPYDVILMDIHMPVMDGITATRAIRSLPPPFCDLPIIGVSADALPHEKEKYLDAGLDDYVTKPIQWSALFGAIDRLTRSKVASAR